MSPIKGGAGPGLNMQAFTYTQEGEPVSVPGVIDMTMEKEDIASIFIGGDGDDGGRAENQSHHEGAKGGGAGG